MAEQPPTPSRALRDLAAVAVGIALALMWTQARKGAAKAQPPALVAAEPGHGQQKQASDSLRQGERRLPVAGVTTTREAIEAPVEVALAAPLPEIPSEAALENKYKYFEGLEIVGAAKGFQFVYHARATHLLNEMLARGEYTTEIVESGQEFGPATHRGMWPGDSGPTEMVRATPLADGLAELRRAFVFPSDDPALFALDVERAWLWNKARPFMDDE